jgi:hypothetical protein
MVIALPEVENKRCRELPTLLGALWKKLAPYTFHSVDPCLNGLTYSSQIKTTSRNEIRIIAQEIIDDRKPLEKVII